MFLSRNAWGLFQWSRRRSRPQQPPGRAVVDHLGSVTPYDANTAACRALPKQCVAQPCLAAVLPTEPSPSSDTALTRRRYRRLSTDSRHPRNLVIFPSTTTNQTGASGQHTAASESDTHVRCSDAHGTLKPSHHEPQHPGTLQTLHTRARTHRSKVVHHIFCTEPPIGRNSIRATWRGRKRGKRGKKR